MTLSRSSPRAYTTSYKPGGSLSISRPVAFASMESVVRPFTRAERLLQHFKDARQPEREDSETDIRWGRASRFQITDPEQTTNPGVVVRTGGADPGEQEEPPAEVVVYQEVDKCLELIRVENPDDSEQWVETARRVWSLMMRPDGSEFVFAWDNSDIG